MDPKLKALNRILNLLPQLGEAETVYLAQRLEEMIAQRTTGAVESA